MNLTKLTTLSMTLTDTVTSKVFTQSFTVNIPFYGRRQHRLRGLHRSQRWRRGRSGDSHLELFKLALFVDCRTAGRGQSQIALGRSTNPH